MAQLVIHGIVTNRLVEEHVHDWRKTARPAVFLKLVEQQDNEIEQEQALQGAIMDHS